MSPHSNQWMFRRFVAIDWRVLERPSHVHYSVGVPHRDVHHRHPQVAQQGEQPYGLVEIFPKRIRFVRTEARTNRRVKRTRLTDSGLGVSPIRHAVIRIDSRTDYCARQYAPNLAHDVTQESGAVFEAAAVRPAARL